jgi:hypothetical protein
VTLKRAVLSLWKKGRSVRGMMVKKRDCKKKDKYIK